MLSSGFARSYTLLALLRAVTGIGIGGILASADRVGCGILVEPVAQHRQLSVHIGLLIGGDSGGRRRGDLIGRFGWRTAFEFGALASIVMLAHDVLGFA